MDFDPQDEALIRSYLLGELPEAELQALEKRVLCDSQFSEQVLVIEESLVEDYIEGKLNGGASDRLEKLLLSTRQGVDELRFTRALKEYASKASTSERAKTNRGWWNWERTPRWALAAAGLFLIATTFGVWREYFVESDLDKGLTALSRAFQRQRPTEARLTVLEYAVRPNARGPELEMLDSLSLRRAEIALRSHVEKSPDAKSFHALGCFYLADRDLDRAIDSFERALQLTPNSAEIHSDLGVARLEKGKAVKAVPGEAEAEFSKSLEHLNRALELDPNLLAALFNRALLHQQTLSFSEAAEDWRQYIAKDPSSPWAGEARTNVLAIEDQK